jgi:hypothetical protein
MVSQNIKIKMFDSAIILDSYQQQVLAHLESAMNHIACIREHHCTYDVPRGYSRGPEDLLTYERAQSMLRLIMLGIFSEDGLCTDEQKALHKALAEIHQVL